MNFKEIKNIKITNTSSNIIKNFLIILIILIYLSVINKNTYTKPMRDIELIHNKIELTYNLVNKLDDFKTTQELYNIEVINYLNSLSKLVDSLYYNKQIDKKIIEKIDTTKNNINNFFN
jgi:hypothetical protein